MQRKEMRGIVVYVSIQGESNKRVGIYTEEGMLYFTIYGARSSKGHSKAALSLFTMGRFVFSIGAKEIAKFVDVQVYDNAYALTKNIEHYYAACTSAEIVRAMPDAEHKFQFKIIIDFLLYLTKPEANWRIGLIVFLWRSLDCNGWDPEISEELLQSSDIDTTYVQYVYTEGFVKVSSQDIKSKMDIMEYSMIDILSRSTRASYREISDIYEHISQGMQQTFINVLLNIWQDIIGYKLKLSDFMIH